MIHRHSFNDRKHRRGFTLLEAVIVMTIMAILVTIPVPRFLQALEQSKLDVAAANLRAIWNAQRFYYLEQGKYGTLAELASDTGSDGSLIDPTITAGDTYYSYSITVSTDGSTFVATATNPGTSKASGSLSIDQTGTLTTAVYYDGSALTPSLEPGS